MTPRTHLTTAAVLVSVFVVTSVAFAGPKSPVSLSASSVGTSITAKGEARHECHHHHGRRDVVLIGAGAPVVASTNSAGAYDITTPNLAPGSYAVQVVASGTLEGRYGHGHHCDDERSHLQTVVVP